MRCDQPQGLPSAAYVFLKTYTPTCPTCKQYRSERVEIGRYGGYDETPLYRHVLKDGRTADEFEQATRFSSGPMIFLGLKVSDGTTFLWTESEMNEKEDE